MPHITKFIENYERELDFYTRLAALAEDRVRKALAENGILALVTSRAKRPDRLAEKLRQRNREKNYKSVDDIRRDVVDLSGVRVAVYFPSQEPQVVSLIKKLFDIKVVKDMGGNTAHPTAEELARLDDTSYNAQFAGYRATHLRVELGPSTLFDDHRRYGAHVVEIQVASLLMHAWSEVNHDLAYKNLSGRLSDDETRILDGINGLIRTGEVMLSQLKVSMDARISTQKRSFANYFELGAFVQQFAPYDPEDKQYRMGSLSWLLYVAKHLDIDNAQSLGKVLQNWSAEPENLTKFPVVRSILDYIFSEAKQPEVDPMSSPFLLPGLNEKFSNADHSETDKLLVLCNILGYACDPSVIDHNKNHAKLIFPESYHYLHDKGYLNLDKVPEISEAESAKVMETVKDLWTWFAKNDASQVRVALGIGRARKGKKY
ncbi:hypothetical protein BX600DRAFT_457240 [Xylariales sp. PMI_506]|nr:hypothetical protein BX600DRAFT_457240 [Xylariales sp. PMI_506]